MLIGYNCPRPTRENYDDFVSKLKEGLMGLNIKGLSLMVYGSYVRNDCDFGRSDIDGVLILSDNVVLNKANLASCSVVFSKALGGNNVPIQIGISDLTTMTDGRFNSYNQTFEDYFKQEGTILLGLDYRREFRFSMPTHPEQSPLTFNLRKCRQGLLMSQRDLETDYESFLRKFNKSLDAISRGSKQILHMADGRLTHNRFSALERISQVFPDLDTRLLKELKNLYQHPEELDELYRDTDKTLDVWNRGLTFFEEMIKTYVERFPLEVSDKQP